MSDFVLSQKRDAALWITINRPEKRNALNDDVIAAIMDAWRAGEADDEVRAIVLTGAGEKAFCAGGDLQPGQGFAFDFSRPNLLYADMLRMALASTKVSIARVNGACLAGGMGLLCMTDFAVATETATFGLPEVKIGVFPMQVLTLLQRVAPRRIVAEWCLTGETFSADDALAFGLLNRTAKADALDEEVMRLANLVAQRSPTAIRRGKYALRALTDMTLEQGLAYTESQIMLLAQTEDAKEGLAAFAEKRPPRWTGR
ncbi:enoyl-CoA hydratase-related protein [Mesorhizobium sp. CAU 1732]|uniref:enoyl-CoA hydratase-related protein n=1 Tax=Mesorhizobium sp. CAU 1732 TaxID=3140358 RepID=UPI0032602586